MPEGREDQRGESGRGAGGPERPGRRSEGDLLAERRARRAAESGEVILTRRAEAAEATVQTLERHVATLQERLLDAEEDLRRTAELLEIEKTAALEREHELRRVKQREYAEQQLRVEAEDRLGGLDRDSRAESERLARRLSSSEQDARELADRLEGMQRQLAEAEQAAASERAAVRRAEEELLTRLGDLESRTNQMQQGLQEERAARERSEALLEGMREGHRRMEGLVGEMKGIVERLTTALAREAPSQPLPPVPSGAEMADALAAAVERLRARAEAVPDAELETFPEGAPPMAPGVVAQAPAPESLQAAPEAAQLPADPVLVRPRYKHSLSLIGRLRLARKQRRAR
jgi:chromosome segregation ATPase